MVGTGQCTYYGWHWAVYLLWLALGSVLTMVGTGQCTYYGWHWAVYLLWLALGSVLTMVGTGQCTYRSRDRAVYGTYYDITMTAMCNSSNLYQRRPVYGTLGYQVLIKER